MALKSLHERHIAYRDLKPENIAIDGNGHIRLADFGLAKRLEHLKGHLTKTACGASARAAPEMLGRNPYCQTLDLWSRGVREKTFPEMLCLTMLAYERLENMAADHFLIREQCFVGIDMHVSAAESGE